MLRDTRTDTVPPLLPSAGERRLASGTLIGGRYEVRGYLGRGGHGTVYRVFDREVKQEVALKLLHPEEESPNALSRLRREVRVARDAGSPRLVRIFDIATAPEGTFLTMEFVDGPSLREVLRNGPLPVEEAVRIACHILEGLAVLHGFGIVHRDVKPGNIILTRNSQAKLADFGLSRRLDGEETRITKTEGIVGTLAYLAPEQLLGREEARKPSDLYAAGVVLFEMLTGKRPREVSLEFGNRLAMLQRAPDARRFRPEVPPWLARVVARLLEVHPRNRYRSAEEVLEDLEGERGPSRIRLWRTLRAVVLLLLTSTVLPVPAPEARFSHLEPLGETGIAAVGTKGECLWKREGVVSEIADRSALVRLTPGGPKTLALVLARRYEWSPEAISTLSFLDLGTGKVVREVKLPSGASFFPNDPPRFTFSSAKALDLFHDGTDQVIVNYSHVPEAPFYAVLYVPRTNQSRIVYYSRGGQDFEGTADLDGDGMKELLFVGINNGWNWVNTVAAVRIAPRPWDRSSWSANPAGAADVIQEPEAERSLLWYAVVPRGHLEDPERLSIDQEKRELTVHYRSGKTWTLGFDGFPQGSPGNLERQEARAAAYAHLREAARLRKAERFDLAMSEAKAAFASATGAREVWLSQYAERVKAMILVDEGRVQEAEQLFASLAERAEDAPEVAYDAAVAFHLRGDLPRAVAWYERGIGRESAMGAGKSKHEFLKGEVLALVEEKHYEEALRAVDRFGATYPFWQPRIWLFQDYVRWRAGERPEGDLTQVRPNWTDLDRYWALEFAFAEGGDPQAILPQVNRFLAEQPETRAEALSLRAELLSRLGRRAEASEDARSALHAVRSEKARSIVARGHEALLSMRASHLASSR